MTGARLLEIPEVAILEMQSIGVVLRLEDLQLDHNRVHTTVIGHLALKEGNQHNPTDLPLMEVSMPQQGPYNQDRQPQPYRPSQNYGGQYTPQQGQYTNRPNQTYRN